MTSQETTCQCKVCGMTVKVLKNGKLARHGYQQRGRLNSGNTCPGACFKADITIEELVKWADRIVEISSDWNRREHEELANYLRSKIS